MLDIIVIKNLLEEKFNKVQFIKVVDETKYVYEYVYDERPYDRMDDYSTIIIETEGFECEEDAVIAFTSEHVYIGQWTEEFDGEPTEYQVIHITRGYIGMDERSYDDITVKTYKTKKAAVNFAMKYVSERNISFNGIVWLD